MWPKIWKEKGGKEESMGGIMWCCSVINLKVVFGFFLNSVGLGRDWKQGDHLWGPFAGDR